MARATTDGLTDAATTNTDTGTRRRTRARGGLVLAGEWGEIPQEQHLDLDKLMHRIALRAIERGERPEYDDLVGLFVDVETYQIIRYADHWPTITLDGREYLVDRAGPVLLGRRIEPGPRSIIVSELREAFEVLPLTDRTRVSAKRLAKMLTTTGIHSEATAGAVLLALHQAGIELHAIRGSNMVEVPVSASYIRKVEQFIAHELRSSGNKSDGAK